MSTERIVNPTPKQRFLCSNDNISKHRTLVDSREFERGADFALAEYSRQLMDTVGDGNTAAGAGLKLRGAHEFLGVFRRLSENDVLKVLPKPQDNLKPV